MEDLKIRSRFDGSRVRPARKFTKSKTKQSFSRDADINNIMRRYRMTGLMVDPNSVSQRREAFYGDFSDLPDLQSLRNRVIEIDNAFMTLPSNLRTRFENNAENLLLWLNDPENEAEAIELGLKEPAPAPEAPPAPLAEPSGDAPIESPPEPPEAPPSE